MKAYLAFALIVVTSIAFGQTADYFANNPQWRQSSGCANPYPCIEKMEFVYYINGETTIGQYTYKNIYKRGVTTYLWLDAAPVPSNCQGTWTFDQLMYHLRQDNKKIYILTGGIEELLYDFDLAVGDTLPLSYNNYHPGLIVTSIDSIAVDSGFRKRFYFLDINNQPNILWEGIGHDMGFMEWIPPLFECANFLECWTLNDTSWYPAYNVPCDLTVDIPEPENTASYQCFPNPAANIVNIQSPTAIDPLFLEAVSMSGQRFILKFKQINSRSISAEIEGLPPGLYVIKIHHLNSSPINIRVIKSSY